MDTQHSKDIKKNDMKASSTKEAKKTTGSKSTDKKSGYDSEKDSKKSFIKK